MGKTASMIMEPIRGVYYSNLFVNLTINQLPGWSYGPRPISIRSGVQTGWRNAISLINCFNGAHSSSQVSIWLLKTIEWRACVCVCVTIQVCAHQVVPFTWRRLLQRFEHAVCSFFRMLMDSSLPPFKAEWRPANLPLSCGVWVCLDIFFFPLFYQPTFP